MITCAALIVHWTALAAAPPVMHQIRGEVLDAGTGKSLPARVYIQGGDGSWHFPKSASPSGSAVEYQKQKSWNPDCVEMHTTLSAHPFIAAVPPGSYTIVVERGKEYLPESLRVEVEREDVQVTIRLRRWIDMAERGWYSGDTHVHRPLEELPNLLLAEDLNVAFPLVSWVTDAFASPARSRRRPAIPPNGDAPAGRIQAAIEVDATHVIYPRNTEYEIFNVGQKSHTLGAFFVLGHQTLFEEGVPPARAVLRRARAEGALIELDKHNWPWSMMLVPVLGADLYELANNHLWRTGFGYRDYGVPAAAYMGVERDEKGWTERGWADYGFQNYYALLDSGFRLRPTAGTASGVHPVPLGFGRVYVRLEKGFSYQAWVRGLDEGRSFVTTGPMLLVQVNGREAGAVFKAGEDGLRSYRVAGVARSAVPLKPLEIVVNGEVARSVAARNREAAGGGFESAIDEELTLDRSSWIAVRCFEDRSDGRVRFAHTGPFHIEVPGKPLRPRRAEIEYLIGRVEAELSRNAGVLPEEALEEYREALRIYRAIAGNALPPPAAGPLRIHPRNPRYFTAGEKNAGGSLKAVYLTGAHTWNNLVDMSREDPPGGFDFNAYLDFLDRHGHNFIRLWAWDSTVWDTRANGPLGKDSVHHVAPLPWARTGPGQALDGKPRFDLTRFDPAYFERLRTRVGEAGRRGIYVSVMMFEGWGLMHGNRGRAAPEGWASRAHPFHPRNNVNGIDPGGKGDAVSLLVHGLADPEVQKLQAAYIRKVVDTVNHFDNVLYEVVNEGGQKEWDWWVVETIRGHERTKPKQHPIGLTGHGAERLPSLLASAADWTSPGRVDGHAEDPPPWDREKVSLLDTDHIWGVGGSAAWVWKSFLRGHNPIFMDPYDGSVLGAPSDPRWEPIRRAMGHTRRLAERMDLAAMTPRPDLASTGWCLASPGEEYLIYQPGSGEAFSVELKPGSYRYEWLNAAEGAAAGGGRVEASGGRKEFKAEFQGDAVLHLEAR